MSAMPTPTPEPRPNAAAMMPWMLGCGGLVSLLCAPVAWANPQGLVVVAGIVTAETSPCSDATDPEESLPSPV